VADPETLLPGESRAPSGEVEIAFQDLGRPGDPPILLIPGLGTQLIYWDEALCGMLADRGFRVIRMENRDTGHSTVLEEAGKPGVAPMLLGLPRTLRYGLPEMADDAIAVLDHLEIERAHLAGFSMGGMIVQTMAIRHPDRILSMCSIMSRTGARRDAFPGLREVSALLRNRPEDRESFIRNVELLARVLGSRAYPPNPERVRRLSALAWERGIHRDGTARQMHAVNCQSDRTAALGRLEIPVLVIHGAADRLVFPRGGRATAAAIPNSRLRIFEGMAHDLPEQLWPEFAAEIEANALRRVGD
jgi:pimeloyl-ACP methyl ester carboxylesterase